MTDREQAYIVARLVFDGSEVKLAGADLFSEENPTMGGLMVSRQVTVAIGYGANYMEGIEHIKRQIHDMGQVDFFSALLSRSSADTIERLGLKSPDAHVAADMLRDAGFEDQANAVLALPRLEAKVDETLRQIKRMREEEREARRAQPVTTTVNISAEAASAADTGRRLGRLVRHGFGGGPPDADY